MSGWAGGFGNVRPGISEPAKLRTLPHLCAQYGHPGAAYNPWAHRTWCLCGEVTFDGDHFQHVACCDGPLVEYLDEDGQYRTRVVAQLNLFGEVA